MSSYTNPLILITTYTLFQCWVFVNFALSGNIEVIPNYIQSTSPTTKFYLISNTNLPGLTCKIISKSQNKTRRKRSSEDSVGDKNCPFVKEKEISNDRLKVITDKPESIVLSDLPEVPEIVPRGNRRDFEVDDKEVGEDEDRRNEFSYFPDDLQSKAFNAKVFNKSGPDVGIEGIRSDEDALKAVRDEKEKESETGWKISNETFNYKPGSYISIFHLDYKLPVTSSFKSEFSVECSDLETRANVIVDVVAILRPFPNKTEPDNSLQERQFHQPEYHDLSPCSCDVTISSCDKNCCCDVDCTDEILNYFSCPKIQNDTKPEVIRQKTNFACDEFSSILCVYRNTSPYVHRFHSIEPSLRTLSDYENRVSFQRKPSVFKSTPTMFQWKSRNYKENVPIQLKNGDDFSSWSVPHVLSGELCVESSPVLFLVDRRAICRRYVSSEICDDENSVFNVKNHVVGDSDFSSFEIPKKLFGDEVAKVKLNYYCIKNYENYKLKRDKTFVESKQQETTLWTKCDVTNPTLFFEDGNCNNSVIEVEYLIYWRGTAIDRVEIDFVLCSIPQSTNQIKQRFDVTFRHSPKNKTLPFSTMTRSRFPSFQPEADGKCSENITLLEIGESTLSSCEFTVLENITNDCVEYRNSLCKRHAFLWRYVEENYQDLSEIVFLKNETFCDSTSVAYNSCSQFPTQTLIEVLYINLGKMPDSTYFRVIGILLSYQTTPCYPPVGIGENVFTNVLGNESSSINESFSTPICKLSKQVQLSSHVQFTIIQRRKYHTAVTFTSIGSYFSHYFSTRSWFISHLFPFVDRHTEPLTFSLGILFSIAILLISCLILYQTTPIKTAN